MANSYLSKVSQSNAENHKLQCLVFMRVQNTPKKQTRPRVGRWFRYKWGNIQLSPWLGTIKPTRHMNFIHNLVVLLLEICHSLFLAINFILSYRWSDSLHQNSLASSQHYCETNYQIKFIIFSLNELLRDSCIKHDF